MTIFAITTPPSNVQIGPAITRHFPGEHIQAWDGCWFIASPGTVGEVAAKLSVADGSVGTVIVTSVANYWGRANPEVWEWLNSGLERK
jgi:hypothetical protein